MSGLSSIKESIISFLFNKMQITIKKLKETEQNHSKLL